MHSVCSYYTDCKQKPAIGTETVISTRVQAQS